MVTKLNICMNCERTLERRDDETDSVVIEASETQCCCGSIDEYGNYFDALCLDCCEPRTSGVWEGKSAGGGYYIVNPSY